MFPRENGQNEKGEGVVWFRKQPERPGSNFPQVGRSALTDIQHNASVLTLTLGKAVLPSLGQLVDLVKVRTLYKICDNAMNMKLHKMTHSVNASCGVFESLLDLF